MFLLDEAGRDAGFARTLPVAPELRDVVETIWLDEIGLDRRRFRVVPDHAPHLLYKIIRGDRTNDFRIDVVGARSRFVDVDKSNRVLTCGVRLRPGAIPRLFGVSAAELCNQSVSIEALCGPSGTSLLECLAETRPDRLGDVMQPWLRARLVSERTARLTALDAALSSATPLRVASLADKLGLSARGVQLYLQRHVGLAPKRYLQVNRLLRALQAGLSGRKRNWSKIAAASGFSDQSHLIRECRQLVGETPEQFALRRCA
jgi:AraC-like DNA-binding protein